MSGAAANHRGSDVRRHLANRWQIPLLLVSAILFGWGVWGLRPQPPKLTFEEALDRIGVLRKAGLLPEASRAAEQLLADKKRTGEEKRTLHRFLAEVAYEAESRSPVKNAVNAERVIRYYRHSVDDPADLGPEELYRTGEAWEWLNRPLQAVKAFEEAIAKGFADAMALRRRIVELKIRAGGLTVESLAKELDAFVAFARSEGPSSANLMWATERRVNMLLDEGRFAEAETYLESVRPAMDARAGEADRNRFDFLFALTAYYQGRSEEAERIVRLVRDRMTVRDDTDAATGWLLGRLLQDQNAPESALGMFETVCETHFEGVYVAAAKLGRAECLAQLDHHGDAVAAYREAVGMLERVSQGRTINAAAVAASAAGWYQAMRNAGKPDEALAYLEVAADLVPSDDLERRAIFAERRADLLTELAHRDLRAAAEARPPATRMDAPLPEQNAETLRKRASSRLVEAGNDYLQVSALTTADETRSAAAVWKAADRFDEAGDRYRAIDVLNTFVEERPHSVRIPAVLLRLGQSYQALHLWPEAIERYQRNVSEFARTPSGLASIVPLAECYMAMGPDGASKAEQVLLGLLEEAPDRPPLVTPAAAEYRDALFTLADLYVMTNQYDRAIVRLEEALTRYPEDPRAGRSRFKLAEAYRRSAIAIGASMGEAATMSGRDRLEQEYRRRLRRAGEFYDQVIAAAGDVGEATTRPAVEAGHTDEILARMSYLYRADCLFDELEHAGGSAADYAEAIRLYDAAAWRFRNDAASLAAYVQIIQCYLRMGDLARARTTLERAKWILRGLPEDRAAWRIPGEDKRTWGEYFAWLGASPLFREQ